MSPVDPRSEALQSADQPPVPPSVALVGLDIRDDECTLSESRRTFVETEGYAVVADVVRHHCAGLIAAAQAGGSTSRRRRGRAGAACHG